MDRAELVRKIVRFKVILLRFVLVGLLVSEFLLAYYYSTKSVIQQKEFNLVGEGTIVDQAVEQKRQEMLEYEDDQEMYFKVGTPFLITYSVKGKQKLLLAEVHLVTRNSKIYNTIPHYLPLIQHEFNHILSSQEFESMYTSQARALIKTEMLDKVQEIMRSEHGVDGISAVVFAKFVMQ